MACAISYILVILARQRHCVDIGICVDIMKYRWSSARAVLLDEEGERSWIGVGSMSGRLFTDKLVLRWLEVLGVWLDSATPFPSAYPAHASGSPKAIGVRATMAEDAI